MTAMEKEFVPYQESLELKKLGFDEPCFGFYFAGGVRIKQYKDSQNRNSAFFNNTVCSIPTFSQAFRWFREKYGDYLLCFFGIVPHFTIIENLIIENPEITFKEAEIACLKKLIEIVKNKKL